MNILLTNDDGVHAPGMRALCASLPSGVHAVIAAPATERSASSHSITLGDKLRVEEDVFEGIPRHSVHGTPADSVKFAIGALRKTFKPDLIVSDINQGANTGVSVFYSGTISAAREGFISGIPAMAVSLASKTSLDFSAAVWITRRLIEGFRDRAFASRVMLNVNVPPLRLDQIRGVRAGKQAASRFVEEFVLERTHDGKKIYSLTGEIEILDPDGTSDEELVVEGFIAVTPLQIDLTDYASLAAFQEWVKHTGLGVCAASDGADRPGF